MTGNVLDETSIRQVFALSNPDEIIKYANSRSTNSFFSVAPARLDAPRGAAEPCRQELGRSPRRVTRLGEAARARPRWREAPERQ